MSTYCVYLDQATDSILADNLHSVIEANRSRFGQGRPGFVVLGEFDTADEAVKHLDDIEAIRKSREERAKSNVIPLSLARARVLREPAQP